MGTTAFHRGSDDRDVANGLAEAAAKINQYIDFGIAPSITGVDWPRIHNVLTQLSYEASGRSAGTYVGGMAVSGNVSFSSPTPSSSASGSVRKSAIITFPPAVHVTLHGYALCGMPGKPWEWEKGHTQVSMVDHIHSTCGRCIDEVKRRQARQKAEGTTAP